jgi:hypothetical protein
MIVDNPKTFFIEFNSPFPKKFEVYRNENLYFERFLDGKTGNIKFNIPDKGDYLFNIPVKNIKEKSIEIPDLNIPLPPFERNRIKDFRIITNRSLTGSPLRVFTMEGIVERSPIFFTYPIPNRIFLLLHEVAHFWYKTEKYCDLLALLIFISWGYNISTAIYCLTNILSEHPMNDERIKYIYDILKQKGFV